jgi:PAS domain S-box-containing protein
MTDARRKRSRRAGDGGDLKERIAYLEGLKAFQDEAAKVIRVYTSNPVFTSERCAQEIVNFIARRLDLYLVSLLLVDEATSDLRVHVYSSRDPVDPGIREQRIPIGRGLIGTCAQTGETVAVDDVTTDSRYIPGPLPRTRAEMCIPVKIRHRVAGVLDLHEPSSGRFTRDFQRLLEDLTTSLAFVLEAKRLYEDIKGANQQLEMRIEEKVRELRKSEERYRAIVENATDAMFTIDAEGHFTWANRAAGAILGRAPDQVVGLNLCHVVKKGHVHKLFTAMHQALDGRDVRPAPLEILTQGGEERTVEFSLGRVLENGAATGVEGTMRDITDRVVIDKLKKNYMKSLEEAVIERTSEIKETQRASILAIANLAESIDDDTGGHLQRIRHYCKVVAEDLRRNSRYKDSITEEYSELIYDLSPLHDLGKVGIRDSILQKPDKLTNEEFEKMKDHAEIGARALRMAGEMINRESIFSIGEMIARYHHEKWDGTGYPAVEINGEYRPLRGDEIPLCARIVAIADVYDALTSKRPYKMPFPHEKAREMILSQEGKHFDPEIVRSFIRSEQEFVNIRNQFPDTHIPEGHPFVLPARDRA